MENTITTIYQQNTQVRDVDESLINKRELQMQGKKYKVKKKWMNENILIDVNKKNNLWKRIRKCQSKDKLLDENVVKLYRELKNKISKEIVKSKQKYLYSQIEKDKNMWESINKLTNNKKSNVDDTIKKHFKGQEVNSLAEKFNTNFIELTDRLKCKYEREDKSKNTNRQSTNIRKSNFVLPKAKQTDFVDILQQIKNSHAMGTDQINVKNLKDSAQNTARVLAHLTNAIIEKKVWPKKLKVQMIRPIFKKGKKSDFNNYRPISILPIINKLIEKFFAINLQKFLSMEKIIQKDQYGFQKGKGTNEALKKANEKIAKALHEGKRVGAIFIDLQKAFDTINREILIQKIRNYGLPEDFCGVLECYLSERTCCVKIDQTYSQQLESKYGVPQGSILGPILFLIYINDITETDTANKLDMLLFADDILCLVFEKDLELLCLSLQNNLNYIQNWCLKNELYISEEKTKIMLFKTKEEFHSTIQLHEGNCTNKGQECKCTIIKATKSIKYLGLIFDDQYNFEIHMNEMVKKIRQIIPKLYYLRKVLNCKNNKIIYDAWIKSILQYGIEVYANGKAKSLKRLEKIQNKVIKILFGNRKRKHAKDIYTQMKILKVKELHRFVILIKYFFKIKNKREEIKKEKSYDTKYAN
jgi:hypothetical protein